MTLKNELEDLEASWDFAMKGDLDSDSEEDFLVNFLMGVVEHTLSSKTT